MTKLCAALAEMAGPRPRATGRRTAGAALTWGALLFACAVARAHEPPKGLALVWPDGARDGLPVVLTNRGLVFADTGGARLSLRCNEAYGVNTAARPRLWADAQGRLVLATYAGVSSSADRGCSWHKQAGLPEAIGRPIQHPRQPNALLVATVDVEPGSSLLVSDDYGASWSLRGQTAPYQAYTALAWAPSEPARVYASGMKIDLAAAQVLWLWAVSSDGGRTFEELTVERERKPLVVHPENPDVVFAYELVDALADRYRVLRSEDAGRTFEQVIEVSDVTSFAASPGGREMWLGAGRNGGLYRSRDHGKRFARVYEDIQEVQCLHQRAGKLWVCANMRPNVDGLWTSEDGGQTFERVFTFNEVSEPVRCDAAEAMGLCELPWLDWQRELLTWAAPDAGAPDAGNAPPSAPDAGAVDSGAPVVSGDGSAPAPASRASCALGPAAPARSWWAWLLSACAALAWRRRRRG
jgi:MYXO-CTERM domain-containing protein